MNEACAVNGDAYIAVETRQIARQLGLRPINTPVCSPQSNGMAESFVNTFKRDYVDRMDRADARTVMAQMPKPSTAPAKLRARVDRGRATSATAPHLAISLAPDIHKGAWAWASLRLAGLTLSVFVTVNVVGNVIDPYLAWLTTEARQARPPGAGLLCKFFGACVVSGKAEFARPGKFDNQAHGCLTRI